MYVKKYTDEQNHMPAPLAAPARRAEEAVGCRGDVGWHIGRNMASFIAPGKVMTGWED